MTRSSPASFGQEQLWLIDQASPGTTVNHSVRAWELFGSLDVPALRDALNELVVTYEVLRTTLHPAQDGLRQRVEPPRPVPLPEVVLKPHSDLVDVLQADPTVAAVLSERFDLSQDLMIRAVLAGVGPEHHVLVLNVHHTACDGWSFILLREYLSSAMTEQGGPRRTRRGRYLSYAVAEREAWAAGGQSAARDWLLSLHGLPLPTGPLAPARRDVAGPAGVHRFELPEAEFVAIRGRAVDAGVTVNMALTALFALVLARWTGGRRVVFATPVGTRLSAEFEHTIGMFVNSLPIVVDVGGDPTFEQLLKRVRTVVLAAIEHAQVPPAEIRAAVTGGRAHGGDPMHSVSFAVEHSGPALFDFGDLTGQDLLMHAGDTSFGLAVRVDLGRPRPVVTMEHDAVNVSSDVVARFGAHLRESLAALVSGAAPVDLPAVPAVDAAALAGWSRGEPVEPGPDFLASVAAWARRRPEAVAVRFGDQTCDYRHLWSAAHRMADVLREQGIGADNLVGVCLPRSVDLVVAVLGVLVAGAAFVPLDSRDPLSRTDMLLNQAHAAALIFSGQTFPAEWCGPVFTVPPQAPASYDALPPVVHPDSLAYVIFTSGTTGTPKGVQITHGGLVNYLQWAVTTYRLAPGTRVPLHTSVAYDLAITSLLGPLHAGGEIVVLDDTAGPMAVADVVGHDLLLIKGTPNHLAGALTADASVGPGRPAVLVLGGENLPVEYVRQWHQAIPGVRVVNEYGPTETVVGSVAHEVPTDASSDIAPIGRPIANTIASVLDDRLTPVPIGVLGELVIGGAGVARGYLYQPGLTAGRFVPDPSGSGGRIYRTGDLARWLPDGTLDLVGRIDDQVKVLGYRVEPGEVEAALVAAPRVRSAAVVADRRDPHVVRLIGFVCPNGPVPHDFLDTVRDDLRLRLPAHMVPVSMVVLDSLPVNGNGKVNRAELPLPNEPAPATAAARPRGHWQRITHAAWCNVLGVKDVDVDVNFFAAGGTSLMLLALDGALRVRGITGLAIADLFRHPTISALAEHITKTQSSATPPALTRAIRRSVADLRSAWAAEPTEGRNL